ncbi:MAG: DUF3305 domain-containing protein [Burkholderiales bacterium]
MEKPKFPVAVVMQRRPIDNRWQSEVWEPWAILCGRQDSGDPRLLVDNGGTQQWLHAGFELVLHRDELEGYFLNVSGASPKVFVVWVLDEGGARPLLLTASFNEASRWMDGGHTIEGVAMPPQIFAWVGKYVEDNYRPEPEKRHKPRSFLHPKDRALR